MKRAVPVLRLPASIVTCIALLAVATLLLPVIVGSGNEGVEARGGTGGWPQILGLDVSPDASNTATTLGTIERCIRVESTDTGAGVPGPNFNVDAFLDDVPNGKDLAGFNYFLNYDPAYLKVSTCKVAQNWLLGSHPLSSVMNSGDACPNVSGALAVVAADTGGAAGAEVAGALGVLERYGFTALVPASPVCVDLTLSDIVVDDSAGADWWASDGDQVWDAYYDPKYGMVCIDKACPSANTPPTVATPSCSPEPSTVGQSVTCSASFTDDGLGGGPVTCTVNFGDATTVPGTVGGTPTSGTCTATHTYATANTFTVTVQVSDGTLPGSKTASHLVNPPADASPVGGIAELPDVSDSSTRDYIPLATLAAAAMLALTAGAWYARRRWGR